MRTKHRICVIALIGLLVPQWARAVSPTPVELASTRDWVAARFESGKESKAFGPCFSFAYAGKPSSELLKSWDLKRSTRKFDDNRTEFTLTRTDPKTGLGVALRGRRVPQFSDRRMDASISRIRVTRKRRFCPTYSRWT